MSRATLSLWPAHPHPFQDEVLSSWLTRLALANGLSLSEFRRTCLPKCTGLGSDIDLVPDLDFFQALANGSGLPIESVQELGYAHDEGRVFSHPVTRNMVDWIVPATNYDPKTHDRRQALPFCPTCLATDPVPYYRKSWRYAYSPFCLQHGILTDACEVCGAYSYSESGGGKVVVRNRFSTCQVCGEKFKAKTANLEIAALTDSFAIQQRLMKVLEERWIEFKSQPVHAVVYLDGLHILVGVISNPQFGTAVRKWIAAASDDEIPPWPCGELSGRFESKSPTVRAQVLRAAGWLVEKWPSRLVELLEELSVTGTALLGPATGRPFWMTGFELDKQKVELGKNNSDERESAQELLKKKQGTRPTKAALSHFLKTGEVIPVLPRSIPQTASAKATMERLMQSKPKPRVSSKYQQTTDLSIAEVKESILRNSKKSSVSDEDVDDPIEK